MKLGRHLYTKIVLSMEMNFDNIFNLQKMIMFSNHMISQTVYILHLNSLDNSLKRNNANWQWRFRDIVAKRESCQAIGSQ
jgi:hypothetical protein